MQMITTLTAPEAAEKLGISLRLVRQACRERRLTAGKMDRDWTIVVDPRFRDFRRMLREGLLCSIRGDRRTRNTARTSKLRARLKNGCLALILLVSSATPTHSQAPALGPGIEGCDLVLYQHIQAEAEIMNRLRKRMREWWEYVDAIRTQLELGLTLYEQIASLHLNDIIQIRIDVPYRPDANITDFMDYLNGVSDQLDTRTGKMLNLTSFLNTYGATFRYQLTRDDRSDRWRFDNFVIQSGKPEDFWSTAKSLAAAEEYHALLRAITARSLADSASRQTTHYQVNSGVFRSFHDLVTMNVHAQPGNKASHQARAISVRDLMQISEDHKRLQDLTDELKTAFRDQELNRWGEMHARLPGRLEEIAGVCAKEKATTFSLADAIQ